MDPKPIKLLFVCHGNICRSPMGEFVMKQKVQNAGLEDWFEIASAATSTEALGCEVYPPAKRIMAEHGISCKGKRARQLSMQDYHYYDYLIAMDENNLFNLRRMLGKDVDGKISLLLSYTGHTRDVADPWYTDDFQTTWDDINLGCDALLEYLIQKEGLQLVSVE